jgi:nicotinate dehydrogenase subunit B
VPPVDVVVLDRPGEASLGAGEASIGPTAAAIGNALHAATGLRVRNLPLSAANVVAAMDADAG